MTKTKGSRLALRRACRVGFAWLVMPGGLGRAADAGNGMEGMLRQRVPHFERREEGYRAATRQTSTVQLGRPVEDDRHGLAVCLLDRRIDEKALAVAAHVIDKQIGAHHGLARGSLE